MPPPQPGRNAPRYTELAEGCEECLVGFQGDAWLLCLFLRIAYCLFPPIAYCLFLPIAYYLFPPIAYSRLLPIAYCLLQQLPNELAWAEIRNMCISAHLFSVQYVKLIFPKKWENAARTSLRKNIPRP